MGKRKLFCEISPLTYRISLAKCRVIRRAKNLFSGVKFAKKRSAEPLPALIYSYNSLMRRKLGKVDPQLQENKVVNLNLAAPKVTGICIRPGETFSFWSLVGNHSKRRGYREGLTISSGKPAQGIGGGMCQFTNLIHWLVLHAPLQITEHHHHDGIDLFPDFGRQVPFGTGTSVVYNHLDYRFYNDTDQTYQLIVYTTDKYLCGELRAEHPLDVKYHIRTEGERFVREEDGIYRLGDVYRDRVDKRTGNVLSREKIKSNHAKVMYEMTLPEENPAG